MSLTPKQRQYLKGLAHSRKPVVIVGDRGVTEAVLTELDQALAHHELVKVRVNAGDRNERESFITRLTGRAGAELVQHIGHVAVLYRPAEKPVIRLP